MNDSVVDFLGPTDLHVETNGVVTGLSQTHAYVFIEELSSAWKERERLDVLVLRAICRLSVRHPERANEGFSSPGQGLGVQGSPARSCPEAIGKQD